MPRQDAQTILQLRLPGEGRGYAAKANTTVEQLVPGLPREELVERLLFHQRPGEVAERAIGFYLLDMQRRSLSGRAPSSEKPSSPTERRSCPR